MDGFEPVGMAMIIESIVIVLIGWSNVIGTQYLLPTNKVNSLLYQQLWEQ